MIRLLLVLQLMVFSTSANAQETFYDILDVSRADYFAFLISNIADEEKKRLIIEREIGKMETGNPWADDRFNKQQYEREIAGLMKEDMWNVRAENTGFYYNRVKTTFAFSDFHRAWFMCLPRGIGSVQDSGIVFVIGLKFVNATVVCHKNYLPQGHRLLHGFPIQFNDDNMAEKFWNISASHNDEMLVSVNCKWIKQVKQGFECYYSQFSVYENITDGSSDFLVKYYWDTDEYKQEVGPKLKGQ